MNFLLAVDPARFCVAMLPTAVEKISEAHKGDKMIVVKLANNLSVLCDVRRFRHMTWIEQLAKPLCDIVAAETTEEEAILAMLPVVGKLCRKEKMAAAIAAVPMVSAIFACVKTAGHRGGVRLLLQRAAGAGAQLPRRRGAVRGRQLAARHLRRAVQVQEHGGGGRRGVLAAAHPAVGQRHRLQGADARRRDAHEGPDEGLLGPRADAGARRRAEHGPGGPGRARQPLPRGGEAAEAPGRGGGRGGGGALLRGALGGARAHGADGADVRGDDRQGQEERGGEEGCAGGDGGDRGVRGGQGGLQQRAERAGADERGGRGAEGGDEVRRQLDPGRRCAATRRRRRCSCTR